MENTNGNTNGNTTENTNENPHQRSIDTTLANIVDDPKTTGFVPLAWFNSGQEVEEFLQEMEESGICAGICKIEKAKILRGDGTIALFVTNRSIKGRKTPFRKPCFGVTVWTDVSSEASQSNATDKEVVYIDDLF